MSFAGVRDVRFCENDPIEVPSLVTIDWIDQRLIPEQGLKMGKDKSKIRDAKKAGQWSEKKYIGIPELKALSERCGSRYCCELQECETIDFVRKFPLKRVRIVRETTNWID